MLPGLQKDATAHKVHDNPLPLGNLTEESGLVEVGGGERKKRKGGWKEEMSVGDFGEDY